MKIIVFSDSHGRTAPITHAIEKEGKSDMIIHAGDVLRDVEDLKLMYPRENIVYVKGNNDFWDRETPEDRFFEIGGVKIFLTHGHNYGVKYTLAKLKQHAQKLGAQVCIFGHTHCQCNENDGGIIMFNPGSSNRSYGVVEIHDGKASAKICEI